MSRRVRWLAATYWSLWANHIPKSIRISFCSAYSKVIYFNRFPNILCVSMFFFMWAIRTRLVLWSARNTFPSKSIDFLQFSQFFPIHRTHSVHLSLFDSGSMEIELNIKLLKSLSIWSMRPIKLHSIDGEHSSRRLLTFLYWKVQSNKRTQRHTDKSKKKSSPWVWSTWRKVLRIRIRFWIGFE